MHVLYVSGQDSGGLPHYTAELANAVAAHADVTVLKPSETSADDVFDDAVDVRSVFRPLGLSVARISSREFAPLRTARGILSYRYLREIRAIDPDLVHDATDLFPQVKLFLKAYGIDRRYPLVVTRHEVEQNRFSLARPHHAAEELADCLIPDLRSDGCVVHTRNQRQALVDRGASAADIRVIPHGAYSLFGTHEDIDSTPEENCLLFFGNIIRYKGIVPLIRAIPLVKERFPDVKLLVAGKGRLPPETAPILEAHEENFEVHNRFIPNEEVQEFFERAAVVVLPYKRRAGGMNGHSGVLSAALSFGKPVVTSRAGDFPSLVGATGCGVTVPSEAPEALATAICRVLGDDDARAEMAAASRRLADELSWEHVADQHLSLYETVVETDRTSPES
ncbi:glycosyltransferase family 4 protein [Haloglomus litoreum]|uniref:glycosyltransferase family 4 protein n=1 Tax=Haloglomus litoreum TaxID=3034026 RepID=UPI0023E831D2|nr:glycosyltransferase family 4 protein [Haloglomus sp. DT116]